MRKRKVFLLVLLLILLSGCNVKRVDKYGNKQILDTILSLNIKNYNKIGNGYKYYAPKGVVRINSNSYNDVLKRNKNIYYMYVDVVGYYYKTGFDYKKEDIYLSEKLSYKKKQGYIKIKADEKNKNMMYVQMYYNYAKIETNVDKKELKNAIMDMSYILSSLDFNDMLLNKMYEAGNFNSKEEVFKLFENKEKEGNFLEYIKEYDKYDSKDEESEQELRLDSSTTTTTKSNTKEESKTTANSSDNKTSSSKSE